VELWRQKLKDKPGRYWSRKVFLMLSDGWVYEGYIDEILEVLNEVDGLIEDF